MTTHVLRSHPLHGIQQWRRQVGQRARLAQQHGPRPMAVISYRVRGPAEDGRVALHRLTLVALFDERLASGELATRLVGVAGALDGSGLRFGGVGLSRFDKDLRRAPSAGGCGARLDACHAEFVSFALQLERYLERRSRHPHMPRCRIPRLPVIHAGDKARDGSCFVDLSSFPKRQVIPIDCLAKDLCGRAGETMFDFYHTRFRASF